VIGLGEGETTGGRSGRGTGGEKEGEETRRAEAGRSGREGRRQGGGRQAMKDRGESSSGVTPLDYRGPLTAKNWDWSGDLGIPQGIHKPATS
jgi:hypothetical protein